MTDRIGQQVGNYRLMRLLGQGGQASVYLAEHLHLGTQAAIKLLSGKLTPQDIQGFTHEAQAIIALRHPHIIRLMDFGFEQRLPYLVMEYAAGGSLRARHPSGSSLSLTQVLSYVEPIASALAYAHRKHLIHRDIKPENLLLSLDAEVLLSDFGIVAVAHSTASMKTVDSSGTVHYMAPEQIQGKPRPQSDQYALAVVIYEWITGCRPFLGNSPIEIAMQHLSAPPPPLSKVQPSLPSRVEQVINKALAKEPEQRWASVLDFAQALQEASRTASSTHVPAPQVRPASQDNPAARSDTRWASPEAMGASTSPSALSPDTADRFFPPLPTMDTGQAPLCPLCRQIDRVEKVRGLAASGNSALCQQLSFPEPPAQQLQGFSRENDIGFQEDCQEFLGSTGGCCLLIVLGGIIVIGLGLRIGFLGGSASNFLPPGSIPGTILLILGIIGCICLLGAFVLYRKSAKREEKEAKMRAEENRQRVQKRAKAYKQWERLYYCARDDLVFFPGVSNWWMAAHELKEKITQHYY